MLPIQVGSAVVFGATGLIGRHLIEELRGPDVRITTAGRRPPDLPAGVPPLPFHPVDFDEWVEDPSIGASLFEGVDAVFIALGTTMRRAGSREAFRRVDLHYVLAAARAARLAGAPQLLAVSSLGASTGARTFYLQVKGEAEEALQALGFPSLTLARPSLLLGDREESRPMEVASGVALRLLGPALRGPFTRYRPIEARTVARALVRAAADPATGTAILESHHLEKLGV